MNLAAVYFDVSFDRALGASTRLETSRPKAWTSSLSSNPDSSQFFETMPVAAATMDAPPILVDRPTARGGRICCVRCRAA